MIHSVKDSKKLAIFFAGLERCGKSCRLRWTNYLRPDIKRGKFSAQEEQTIIQLHAFLGNRFGIYIYIKLYVSTIFLNSGQELQLGLWFKIAICNCNIKIFLCLLNGITTAILDAFFHVFHEHKGSQRERNHKGSQPLSQLQP